MFEMKDEYRLGITHIDDQHQKLFEVMEKAYYLLQEEIDNNSKYERIKDIIIELKEYSKIHFNDEEAYMERTHFKFIDTQRREHSEFIKYVHEFEEHKIRDNEDNYIMEILNFLYDWLVNHILKRDMLMVDKE